MTGVEDRDLSWCMRELGITFANLVDELGRPTFHINSIKNYFTMTSNNTWLHWHSYNPIRQGDMCCSKNTIALNAVSSKQMSIIKSIWNKYDYRPCCCLCSC